MTSPDTEINALDKRIKEAEARTKEAEARAKEAEADGAAQSTALDAQKKAAEVQKAIAEADTAVAATFAQGETKPLEGKTELGEQAGFPAEIVAYQALMACAQQVATLVNRLDNVAKVLLVDSLDVAQGDYPLLQIQVQFTLFSASLASHESKFDELLAPPAAAIRTAALPGIVLAATAARSVVSLMADVLGYLRTDYSIKGRPVTISDHSVRAAFAGACSHPTYFLNFHFVSDSPILGQFSALLSTRTTLEGKKDRVRKEVIDPIKAQLATVTPAALNNDPNAQLTAQLREAEAVVTEWEAFSAAFDKYMGSVTALPEGQPQPTLVLAAMRERTRSLGITHLVYLVVASAGGEAITSRRLFPLFLSSPTVSYIGGGGLSYVVADTDGMVLAANTITELHRIRYDLGEAMIKKFGSIMPAQTAP